MASIPIATWRRVGLKWILMFWCCVVMFAGRTQSFPLAGEDSLNEGRSLLLYSGGGAPPSTPSPSRPPSSSPDLSTMFQSYVKPPASPSSVVKKGPVPETQKDDTETATDSASSESQALNPTSPTSSAWDLFMRATTTPSTDESSKKDPPKKSSPSVIPSSSPPPVKEAPATSSVPSPSSSTNTTEDAPGPEPSSSPGSTDSEKDDGNLTYLGQMAKQIHQSPSSSPSPQRSTTPSPSPSPQGQGLAPLQGVMSEKLEQAKKQANETAPTPSPSPMPKAEDFGTKLTGAISTSGSSKASPIVSPSPSLQPEPSIPTTPPSEGPEEAPVESPVASPSQSAAEIPIETPTAAPSEGPTAVPSESPGETPIETPAPVPSEISVEASVEIPTTVPSEVPVEAPVETPASVPSEIPVEASVEIPTTVPSESPAVGSSESPETAPVESPEASFSEILKAVSSAIAELSPTEIPEAASSEIAEAASSEIAEPSILEISATISSIAEPSIVAVPTSEDLIPESVPLESPDTSFIVPKSMESEESIPSLVPLLPPVEAFESSTDSSPIAASSEAPRSSLSVALASEPSPDTSILPQTPSSEPDVPPPIASIEAPLPYTLPVEPTGITPAQILALNPRVRIGVSIKQGKVGVLVPKGVTLKLENVVFEVTDDMDVGFAVEGGRIEFEQVIIRVKPQSASSFHRRLQTTLSKTQKGLLLTNEATTKISNSTFQGGTDSMVDVKSGSQFHCSRCVFKDNKGVQGGAIRAKGSGVKLESCRFEKNAALSGGALYILGRHFGDESTSLTITNSTLIGNKATKEGGSLFVKNVDTCLMNNSAVKEGVAGTQGGGLFVSSIKRIQITGSEFEDNKAEVSCGGAVSLSFCSEIDVSETRFSSNSANDGGALAVFERYKASGKLEISKSVFQSNEAKDRGGAILIRTKNQGGIEGSTDAYVTIYNTSFWYNMATDGGAIYAFSNSGESFNLNIAIAKTQFIGNHAKNSGGGMYCGMQSIVHFGNSVFQSNEAHTGKGLATYCGCSVSKEQTDSLHLQQAIETDGSQPDCATGTVTTASAGEAATSNSKSNTLTYVFITLAVLAALVVVSIAVVLKHKRAMQSNGSTLLRRSLSSFTGPSRLHHIISVPFSDPPESQEDANSTTTALLRRTHEYGEMEHQFDATANIEVSEIGSIGSHFITDEEERMAETIFADDVFAFDAFADDRNAPLLPTISNLHKMTDDNRN